LELPRSHRRSTEYRQAGDAQAALHTSKFEDEPNRRAWRVQGQAKVNLAGREARWAKRIFDRWRMHLPKHWVFYRTSFEAVKLKT